MIKFSPHGNMVQEKETIPNGLPLPDKGITLAVFDLSYHADVFTR
jgi:hypothetical protein